MKLKTKITFTTLVTVLTLFLLIMIIITIIFYREAKEYRNSEINSSFEFFLNQINHATSIAEITGQDLARSGEILYALKASDENKQKQMFEKYLVSRIKDEKSILGGGIWYEPHRFNEKYKGPYAFWEKEKVNLTWEYSNIKYDYHNQPYYRIAIPKDWDISKRRDFNNFRIPPYLDKVGDKELIFVTLSTLMYDAEGKILGITTVDWSFEDLHKLLGQFNITKGSYATLVDLPSSKIVFYPDRKFLMHDKSSLKWTEKINYSILEKNKIFKIENEKIEGVVYDIYFSVTNSDFLLTALVNKAEAYSVIGEIVFRNVMASVVLLALVGYFIFVLVDLSIKPLNKIIEVLRGIASGGLDLKERIHIYSKDEFGELADTFNTMADKIEAQNQEITDHNENLEQKIQERTKELEIEKQKSIARMKELEKYNNALTNLTKSRAISSGDLDNALDEIVEVCSRILDMGRVSIWKYDKKKKSIVRLSFFEKAKGFQREGIEFLEQDFPSYFQHISAERTLSVYDAIADSATHEFSEYYLQNNIFSVLDTPIWSLGKMTGLLSFENIDEKRQWSFEEENFAASVSSLISNALESNEKNLAQINEIRAKAETEFANEMTIRLIESRTLDDSLIIIFNYIMQSYKLDALALYFMTEDKSSLIPYRVEGNNIPEDKLEFLRNTMANVPDNSIFTLALKRKKNTFIPKVKVDRLTNKLEREFAKNLSLKSILYVPIRMGDNPLGMLVIYNMISHLKLTHDELDSIARFSSQFAGVIQKGKILQETESARIEADIERAIALTAQREAESAKQEIEKAKQTVEELNDLIRNLNSVSALTDVMTFLIYYLEDKYNYSDYALWLIDKERKEFYNFCFVSSVLSQETSQYLQNLRFSIKESSGILFQTYSTQEPIYIPVTNTNNLQTVEKELVEKAEFRYFFQLPMVIYGEVIGILGLHKPREITEISREEQLNLQKLSEQIAGSIQNSNLYKVSQKATEEAERERDKSEKLLLNILPKEVAKELKEKGKVEPVYFENITIMFTDFKGFTQIAEGLSPQELIQELDGCFSQFDKITERYNLEKLKTIGDSYMCAAGLPKRNATHAIDSCLAALEIQSFMNQMKDIKQMMEIPYWELRLGIHSGPVMAGVVGEKKFAYDVWGDTVNTASRMESSGTPGKINISSMTYEFVKDIFDCTYRGEIDAKNKGKIKMYYLNRIKAEYSKDEDGFVPNGKFWEYTGLK